MRSSSSELLLDQQQELRKRKLLELAQPKKKKAPKRTCRERVWFYTTSFLAMTAVGGGSALLFLVPLYVDPAISTLAADFVSEPVKCVTTRREDLCGIFNCTWSSCREGCTSDMYSCTHIYVMYSTAPYYTKNATLIPQSDDDDDDGNSSSTVSPSSVPTSTTQSGENFTEEAVLLVNIKGCGYPPEVDCENFTTIYGRENAEFPCFYSRGNRTVVLIHYNREEHVQVIIHYFAVPFIVTLVTSVVLCVMYCDCRCGTERSHRRRRTRRCAVEDARKNCLAPNSR
ncbi:protein tipE isoform X2 [Zootermopsis nevadensis]|uniref:Protein tipE n=1 Tax=Zootermopsis nevadensis TaxID=136037 RepID=A0A067QYD4_ZOONE|nr:protein tipE isoform X2 [Zootermopsis nevadensis]KDR15346.1 Protein tipE [Zootermopsis nevadensis]